jgi:FemAB-related protein (PEP-CTERM system-associated)
MSLQLGKAMQPEIELIKHYTSVEKTWNEYVLRHPSATFFHLMEWGHVLEQTFPYRPFSCVAWREGRISGILPLFLVRNLPFGHALVSTPFAVYGGLCVDDAETELALLHYAQTLARQMKVRYLELRHQEALGPMPAKDLYVTFRKEIDRDLDKNMAAIPRKQRRMIRQGDKYGLVARMGGEEFLKGFYHIYAHSVHNLGTPVFPRKFFANLLREFGSACRILAVFHDEHMVAGVMTFFFRDQIMPHYGGALRDAFQYAVNDFMYWNLLCYGAEQGYRIFDFGRSKQGTGSYDFKRHWGFEPTPLAYQYYLVRQKTLPDQNPLNPRFSLAIQTWKQLPFGLTQWLGPSIVKFFP